MIHVCVSMSSFVSGFVCISAAPCMRMWACLFCLHLLDCIVTWPGRTAASPSVPSGPLHSARAGTGSLDTADALSLQTAGGTLPCWTRAGDEIEDIHHWYECARSTDTKRFSSWAKLASFITVLAQKHYTGQKVCSHILPDIKLADNCLHSINEDLNICLGSCSVSVPLPESH